MGALCPCHSLAISGSAQAWSWNDPFRLCTPNFMVLRWWFKSPGSCWAAQQIQSLRAAWSGLVPSAPEPASMPGAPSQRTSVQKTWFLLQNRRSSGCNYYFSVTRGPIEHPYLIHHLKYYWIYWIHNSQKADEQIFKNVTSTKCNGILFSLSKEGFDACHNRDDLRKLC